MNKDINSQNSRGGVDEAIETSIYKQIEIFGKSNFYYQLEKQIFEMSIKRENKFLYFGKSNFITNQKNNTTNRN